MAVEGKRGCGYRKQGGLYLVGGGLSTPCDRMPFPLDRCRHCGGGVKFTRGPQWLLPDFFEPHERAGDCACTHGGNGTGSGCSLCHHQHPIGEPCSESRARHMSMCRDESPCPVCNAPATGQEFGPHLLLWVGRKHYTPNGYLEEGRRMGVSRRLSALPKGLKVGETWVLLAHLDAVPAKVGSDGEPICVHCGSGEGRHWRPSGMFASTVDHCPTDRNGDGGTTNYEAVKPSPGIFCAFVPRAVELILKQSDATPDRVEKEAKRGVTVVAVPDDDRDHQGSVWDKDEEDSQPELPGVSHG